ncbi:MAG: lytic transglycosylase [Xanthobacteraceae bacterium]|nr:MAG: lytic transglycosylase [Xanthobacteraceae bacterium]
MPQHLSWDDHHSREILLHHIACTIELSLKLFLQFRGWSDERCRLEIRHDLTKALPRDRRRCAAACLLAMIPTTRATTSWQAAAYLREMHNRYGSPGFLAAYNVGLIATTNILRAAVRCRRKRGPMSRPKHLLSAAARSSEPPLSQPPIRDVGARADGTTSADRVQTGGYSEDAPAAAPLRDVSAITPQSSGLFATRSGGEGARCAGSRP